MPNSSKKTSGYLDPTITEQITYSQPSDQIDAAITGVVEAMWERC